LENLQNLYLRNANLKSLPGEIGNLNNLQTLDLARNNISELPPSIGRLQNLQKLLLQHNEHLNLLPEEIGNLTNLQRLDLNSNNISELPPSIGRLQNLKALDLKFMQNLTSLPEEFGNLTNLKELLIFGSGIRLLPDSFENLSGLMYLEFGPASISNLTISLVHQCRSLGHYRFITFGSGNKNKSDLGDTLAFNRARSRVSFVTTKSQSTSMTPKLWPCVLHFASRAFDHYPESPEFGIHSRLNSRYDKPAADAMYLLLVANMESFLNVLIDRNRNDPTSLGGDVPKARTGLPISIGVAPKPTRKRPNPRRSKRRRTRKKS